MQKFAGIETRTKKFNPPGLVPIELSFALKGISLYMARARAREKSGDEIRSAVKEINNLKAELREIKDLIKKIIYYILIHPIIFFHNRMYK